eukprot:s3035_g3.t3
MRLATNCHILSAVDDDGITLEMQWWSETKRGGPRVESEDSSGYHWKEASGHGRAPQAVGFPWEDDGGWVMPGGVRCESNDVSGWLRGLGKDTLADIWDTLLRFAEEPGNDDEGDALACIQGRWYVQTNHTGSAKELVAIQCEERLGIVEARFACEQHPVIRIFALSEWGRHAFRSQIFCSNAALSYAALIPNAKPRKVPLCNPQFAGRIGFLPSMESMALFDDGKRLWVPPVALQGLLPAVLTEGCRFWGICDGDGAVSFVGEPFNPPIYSSLTYSLKVTCQHGVARVTRKVGDKIWVLASPIHAPTGSQIARFANILAPLEAMSHALFWTSEESQNPRDIPILDGQSLTLVELPRVQLRFAPGPDPGGRGLRLFSKEFGGFYLLDRNGVHDAEAWQAATGDPRASDLASYLATMPHAVVLRSTAGAIRILVTNADVVRPAIKVKPFSTDLVVNRKLLVALGLKTFLWDFHESGSLLLTSSLSGTLYLTLLTLLHRDYSAAARLVGSIGFDEGISADEERLLIFNLKSTVTDRHPNASAIRLKLLLALIAHNPKHFLLKPEEELIAGDYADYLVKLNHVSQHCRLLLREEGSLLRNMTDMGADFWPQAVNRKRFVEACLNDSSACVLTYGDSHPGGRREGFLGYQSLSGVMSSYVKNKWYENFTVDEKEAGKSRQDLASLIELMDRFDREDWTCSGTLFFTLYGILTGVSHTKLNGKDVAQTVARLALEKFWLRMVRLCKNPSGDDCRTIRASAITSASLVVDLAGLFQLLWNVRVLWRLNRTKAVRVRRWNLLTPAFCESGSKTPGGTARFNADACCRFRAEASDAVEEVERKNKQLRAELSQSSWPDLKSFSSKGQIYSLPLRAGSRDSPHLPSEPVLTYLAGFFDGDGCVSCQPDLSGCSLFVGQSFDQPEVLMLFHETFGGSVTLQCHGRGLRKPFLRWTVHGRSARIAAQLLAPRSITKREQLLLGAQWPDAKSRREDCKAELRALKEYDSAVAGPCSWEYCAGFFDAEGCIHQPRGAASLILVMNQKHPRVLKCLREFFARGLGKDATIAKSGESLHVLRVCGLASCKQILQHLLAAGLLRKAEQAELALGLTKESASQVGAQLGRLTGNQKFGRRLDADGQARARKILATQQQAARFKRHGQLAEAIAKLGEAAVLKEQHELLKARLENRQLLEYAAKLQNLHLNLWDGPFAHGM